MNIISPLDDEYNSRRLLYENKELFFEVNIESTEEDEEYKVLNDSIKEGHKVLKSTILNLNNLCATHDNLSDKVKMVQNINFEIQQKIDYLKTICKENEIRIEKIDDITDEINFSLMNIVENMGSKLKDRTDIIETDIIKHKRILKTLGTSYGILRNSNIVHTCPVCFMNPVDVFIQPCSHTFCSECIQKTNSCFFCRSSIKKTSKLYFL